MVEVATKYVAMKGLVEVPTPLPPDERQTPFTAKQPPERLMPNEPVDVAARFSPVVKLGVEEAT